MIGSWAFFATSTGWSNQTNSWPFTNPLDYTISDPSKIEVSNGVARLVLASEKIHHTSVDTYGMVTATQSLVVVGPDASVVLSKTGGSYAAQGAYMSRVIDGGVGNTWLTFNNRVDNRNLNVLNIQGGLSTNDASIVALYRMDGSWVDAVSGSSATPFGSVAFTNDAKFGTQSGKFAGGGSTTVNTNLLNGATEISFSMWVKMQRVRDYDALIANQETPYTAIDQKGGRFTLYVMNVELQSTAAIEIDAWHHLVVTWKSAGGIARFYVDGVLVFQGVVATGATISQTLPFRLGNDYGSRASLCGLDDVGVFNRALSADEVLGIYQRATAAKFQLRSGSTSSLAGAFGGPDGTSDSYYLSDNIALTTTPAFSVNDRYVQYRATFSSDSSGQESPWLQFAGFSGSKGIVVDNVWGDLLGGDFSASTVRAPVRSGTPFLGSAQNMNGGIVTNATYTSRVLDGGVGVTWGSLSWRSGEELTNGLNNLEGLWHVNGTWADDSPKRLAGGSGMNVSFSELAKLGLRSVVFNGVNSYYTLPAIAAPLKTLEFWVKLEGPTDGLIELQSGTVYLAVSNSLVVPVGFSASPAPVVYVNAKPGAPLFPGWNHVALTASQTTLTNISLKLGFSNADYFEGQMDEIAVFSRVLTMAEITEHFAQGRRGVAGKVRLQVRADTNSPPQTAFAGPAGLAGYFDDPGGTPLGAYQGQYLQYRVTLLGDGFSTPALDELTITAGTTNFVENAVQQFSQGSFDSGNSRWYGDNLAVIDYSSGGPAGTDPSQTLNIAGLWHMDESSWAGGVLDSSGLGYHGTTEGSALPVSGGRVGTRYGSFNGTTDDILIPSIDLSSNNFTVAMWVKSTGSTRSGLMTSYSAASSYYALEFNGNGSGVAAGRAAFVVNNGVTSIAVASDVSKLNDGAWHHVAGVRNNRQIHIYVDGRLAGTTGIGSNFGSVGSGGAWIGKYGALGLYYAGALDEVLLARRALAEAEIGSLAAAGTYMLSSGVFTGPIIDSSEQTIWQKLWWGADAPYSRALIPGDADLAGLWHLDAVTNGATVVDSSGAGHDGTLTGIITNNAGRFSSCVYFPEGQDRNVSVTDVAALEQVPFSVEAWINPEDVLDHVVVDKRSAGTGYRLGLDASGKPYFWVNGTTCTAPEVVRSRKWTHLVGVCDGNYLRLYVNGILKTKIMVAVLDVTTTAPLLIGLGYDSNGDYFGRIDEVAIFDRVLSGQEIADHYRAGAVTLKLQARSWTSGGPGPFVGPDGTSATYFTDPELNSLVSAIPLNQYFQYQVTFGSEDYLWNPKFQGARVDTATYPQDNPTVQPAAPFNFPGDLMDYWHLMATTNGDSMIRYQLSGNNGTNWFYWDGGQWSDVTGFGYSMANPVSTIKANIGSFFDQLYSKTGGAFKFKAFLHSTGIDQTALDQVDLAYSVGRLVVTAPNGIEVGPKAWLVGVTNVITWNSSGSVSANVVIEYSDTSGTNWTTVTASTPNNGSYGWLTPGSGVLGEKSTCRIRVRDPNDGTITDMSDSDFQLVYRYKIVAPNGGEKWYIGETNDIVWQSPPNVGAFSWLYYNRNGSTSSWSRLNNLDIPNIQGITNNVFSWTIPTTNNALISEQARIRITLQGSAAREDWSDADYILAGFGFITPDTTTAWKRGTTNTLVWVSAGAGTAGVDVDFANDGVSWTNIALAVTNVTGTNSWTWLVTAPNPSPVARLRITSRADARCKGISPAFTVADIDIKTPNGTNIWTAGVTNAITWTAGGAGTSVNLYYSTNNGTAWLPVAMGVTNKDFPIINSYNWLTPNTPGVTMKVKVQSTLGAGELFAVSETFIISGILLTAPNGGELWTLDAINQITWEQAAAGGGGLMQFSYDDGVTYTNIAGPGYSLEALTLDYAPTYPSLRCRARIQGSDMGYTNIFDVSDNYFTVAGLKADIPAAGAMYTMGWTATNGIRWVAAGTGVENVNIFYAPTDGAQQLVTFTPNNEFYPGINTRDWVPAMDLDPSLNARLKFLAFGVSGSYTGLTSAFTLRGVRLTQPNASSVFRIGNDEDISWLNAGFDPAANAQFYLSLDGGATFQATPLLGWATSLDLKTAIWNVGNNAIPTTNAVVKLSVTDAAIPFDAVSAPFTIRGIKVLAPSSNDVWNIGTTNMIQFVAAGGGNLCNIYYSPNGTTYDMANPVALNVAMADGTNTVPWIIESSRQPSATSRIRVQSVTQPDIGTSDLFTLGGIKVIRPISTDIWAIGETNQIQWVSIGTTGTNTVELIMPGPVILPITNNYVGTTLNWVVPPAAVGSNLMIHVIDANGVNAYSVPFRIVPEPTIQIVAPAAGDYWKFSDPYVITWSKAGNMSGVFNVEYSMNDFATSIQILGTPVLTNGTYQLPWTPNDPSKLGAAKIRITNADVPTITDTSSTFYLVPKLTIQFPNGGEDFYAMKPTMVEWLTRGNASSFDLYYSTDLVRRSNNWIKVNTAGPIVGKGNNELSQYLWTVANVKSPVAWIRIQDSAYTNRFPLDVSGPYDDCDATFAINYYTIVWKVYNEATPTNGLDNLSVSDSSGWSASSLTSSPYIVHEYAFGTYDTIWSCQYFFDKILFHWSSEPSRTNDVPMRQAQAAPEYRVMANFAYDSTNNVFKTVAWLERNSQIIADPTSCTITVYDPEGNLEGTVSSTARQASGTFWLDTPAGIDKTRPYFAKVEIKHSGVIYTSGITFALLTPSESAVAAVNAARDMVLASVSNVNENVTGVGAAVGAMRSDVTNRLTSLSNVTDKISMDTSDIRTNLSDFSSNVLAQFSTLTNTIGVIGPSGTNLLDQIAALSAQVDSRSARIITRPSSVKIGSLLSILYRTKPGAGADMTVSRVGGGVVAGPTAMTDVSGGVCELSVATATWLPGDYLVVCADGGAGASDRMIVKLTSVELDDLAGLANVSNQLAGIETSLAGLSSSVSNVQTTVNGTATNLLNLLVDVTTMEGMVATLTNMPTQMTGLTTTMGQIASLTNMNSAVGSLTSSVNQILVLTNMSAQLSGLTNMSTQVAALGALTNLMPQMTGLTNSMAQLSLVTNQINTLSSQMNTVTNVMVQVAGLTNMNTAVAALTNAVAQITVLTNMSSQLNYVTNVVGQIGVLTNLTPQMAGLSNSMARLSVMTNQMNTLSAQMNYVTNVIDQVTALTNINPAVAAMTSAVAQITVLTNMSSQLNYVTNLVGQMASVTNLAPQMSSLTNSMARLSVITNQMNTLSAQMNYVTNVIDQVTALTNINPAVAAMTSAVAQITVLTNMSSQLNYVTNLVGQMASVTNLAPQMSSLTNSMARLSGITNQMNTMAAQMNYLTNVIDQVTALTNINPAVALMTNAVGQIAGLTNMGSQLTYLTNAMFTVQGLTNLSPQVASLTNLVGRMATLTNLTPQVASLTNMPSLLASLTNMPSQMVGLSNVMVQVAGLTNLQSQMSDVTNVIGSLTGLTNLSDQVAVMTNAIGQVAGLTNLPSQMADVTNIVGQLTGITNLSAQVAVMTNAIGQVAGLTNLPSQMADVTNIVGRLSGITNLSDQVSAMTNSIGQIAALTNMGSQLNFLTNSIGVLTPLTNLYVQIADITNAMGQVTALTNLTGQVAGLSNAVGQLTGLTNLGTQVDSLTNAIGQLGSLTNLSDRFNTLTNLPDQVTALSDTMTQMAGLTNLTAQMSDMTNSMGRLAGLTNMPGQVDAIYDAVSRLGVLTNQMSDVTTAIGQLGSLTNLGAQVGLMITNLNQVAALTNIATTVQDLSDSMDVLLGITNVQTQVGALTGAVASVGAAVDLLGVQLGSLTNLGTQVDELGTSIAQISALTNMSGQVNGLVDAVAQLGVVTNLGAQITAVSDTVNTLVTMTNFNTRMDAVTTAIDQLGALTNLGAQADSLSASIGQITALTNMSGQVAAVADGITDLKGTTTGISNTVAAISAVSGSLTAASNALSVVTTMSPMLSSVSSAVTTMSPLLTSVSTAVTGIESGMTDVRSGMTDVQSGMKDVSTMSSTISGAIGGQSDRAGAGTLFGNLAKVEQDLGSVGTSAEQAMSRAGGARSQANSAAGAAARIKKEVAAGQIPQVMNDLMIIRKSLETALTQVKGIPGEMTTADLAKKMDDATMTMRKIADERGVAAPAGGGDKVQAGALNDPKALAELLNKLEETKAMMQATRLLMDEAVNKPVVVDWLEGTK
jgi:hypothetical protein